MLEYKSDRKFQRKVRNFATEVYRIDDASTHIFKLMYTLLELGLGQVSVWQDEAQNSESIAGTKFSDLDSMFSFTGIVRLPGELYDYDPYSDQLTSDQWNEILTKDSLFRIRIMKFLQSLLRGGTLEGVQMMAEAASGVECQVFEMWRVISGGGLTEATPLGRRDSDGNLLLNLANEFVVVPLEAIDEGQRAAIIHLVDLLKPVNSVCTVHTGPTTAIQELGVPFSASQDYFFEVRKLVSADDDLAFQDPNVWIQPNEEVEGPTFAGMEVLDTEWSLNEAVTSIKSYQADVDFLLSFGSLVGGINDSTDTIVVDEANAPTAPSFPIKVEAEEMFVTDRLPVVGQNTQFTYTVIRGENGTTPVAHLDASPVNIGAIPLYAERGGYDAQFGDFRPIPLADSSDNYPVGQFSGDPSKFDSEGNYTYDWTSQLAFVEWFTLQVTALGGEVVGSQYRLQTTVDSVGGLATTPEDALAGPEFIIQNKIFPGRL